MKKVYDLLIIGGGISSSTLISRLQKKGYKGKIAVLEAGRGLGGRFSTRYSSKHKNWIFNHGSPNFNITNSLKNTTLTKFIEELKEKNLITKYNKNFFEIGPDLNLLKQCNNNFYHGDIYVPNSYMNIFLENLIQIHNKNNKIDFYFSTLINKINFSSDLWTITSNKNKKIIGRFLVCSSNLILHKRSLEILNLNEIPLRKAIKERKNNQIDEILHLTNQQSYLERKNFLIFTKSEFKLNSISQNGFLHLIFNQEVEENVGIERAIFQKHLDSKISIIIHTKINNALIKKMNNFDEIYLVEYLINKLNKVLKKNLLSAEDIVYKDISVMKWRASQPIGNGIPERLQYCNPYNIAFCGDWFQFEGFGTIQGAILSGLELSDKIYRFI